VVEDYGATAAPGNDGHATSLAHHYFHNDYQNTIGLVTDDSFNPNTNLPIPQNELSDVFGQPRSKTGVTDTTWGANDVTKRRYINQEDLTDAHLIDLNARIYDPLLGKFLSPDPMIADQDDSQSWNAYAYSHNNPMSKEDPTGLGACPPGAECVNVPPTKPSEPGNPAAAVTPGHPVGSVHNALVTAEVRAAQQGRNSPPRAHLPNVDSWLRPALASPRMEPRPSPLAPPPRQSQ
jgi:RHS repeat-associated protein